MIIQYPVTSLTALWHPYSISATATGLHNLYDPQHRPRPVSQAEIVCKNRMYGK